MYYVINTANEACAGFADYQAAKSYSDHLTNNWKERGIKISAFITSYKAGPTVKDWYAKNYSPA